MFLEEHHEAINTAVIDTNMISMPAAPAPMLAPAPAIAPSPTSKRGFASMDPSRRRLVARKGGQTAHQLGKAHRFNSEEAKTAGRKGLESRKHKLQSQDESPSEAVAIAGVD